MAGKRFSYLGLLGSLLTLWLIRGTWLSWFLLLSALGLPLLSLALSLPAIRHFSLSPTGSDFLTMEEPGQLWLLGSSDHPLPPFRGSICLKHCFTEKKEIYQPEQGLDTRHCGGWRASILQGIVCDYLGLFRFPVSELQTRQVIIRPKPVPIPAPPMPEALPRSSWHPKPGGGFSEQHELRPYRTGDDPKQIHWKLSAKSGSLILREPMEPTDQKLVLSLELSGDPERLDRKLGQLLWLGRRFLEAALPFELRALTGSGLLRFPVRSETGLLQALDCLLLSEVSAGGRLPDFFPDAHWQYEIGGHPNDS